MELLLLATILVSSSLLLAAGTQNTCGCIDRSWCSKEDPKQKLDCPLSHSLCTSIPIFDGQPKRLDEAVESISRECRDGWAAVSLKSTKYGCPNPLVAVVQNDLTNGKEHKIFIDGYGGKYPARFIFKSNDKKGNIPLFMTMFLWEEYIAMNEKKDGQWCSKDVRVNCRVSAENWYMMFKVQMAGENQQFDILYRNDEEYDPIYRFYPQTHIKRGDWFIFYEDYHYILGISWSRPKNVQFKTSPLPGSRIVIHGKILETKEFRIIIRNAKKEAKMLIIGRPGIYRGRENVIEDKNYLVGYGSTVSCSNAYFESGLTVTIVIEVTSSGINYYAQGWQLCSIKSNKFRSSDIAKIDVTGSLNLRGYGSNTCDYYLN